jgi:hypothetical protein
MPGLVTSNESLADSWARANAVTTATIAAKAKNTNICISKANGHVRRARSLCSGTVGSFIVKAAAKPCIFRMYRYIIPAFFTYLKAKIHCLATKQPE